ncbi:MAG: hypothetical protein HYV19_04340 [Gemmatimonadetes bacterium]|nr:hypothetical protein [Gemmatimonadota bacterium]
MHRALQLPQEVIGRGGARATGLRASPDAAMQRVQRAAYRQIEEGLSEAACALMAIAEAREVRLPRRLRAFDW